MLYLGVRNHHIGPEQGCGSEVSEWIWKETDRVPNRYSFESSSDIRIKSEQEEHSGAGRRILTLRSADFRLPAGLRNPRVPRLRRH